MKISPVFSFSQCGVYRFSCTKHKAALLEDYFFTGSHKTLDSKHIFHMYMKSCIRVGKPFILNLLNVSSILKEVFC